MQTLRHYYLQTMGIQVWQSREILPGAKPDSPVTLSPEDSTDLDVNTVSVGCVETNTPLAQKLPDTLVSRTPEVKHGIADAALITPLVSDAEPTQTVNSLQPTEIVSKEISLDTQTVNPEFRIASIVFPGICVVVTEVPVETNSPISTEHLTFLKELLFAIKAPVGEEPTVTLFNWPMLRSAGFDQSAVAACEACQAFLRGQKSKHEVDFVLLMGEVPGQYLLSNEASFAEKKGQLCESAAQPLLLTNSVEQILSATQLKAQLWTDLQPLVTWLQDS